MAITIREYEPSDADAVGDFFMRCHYGPSEQDILSTGEMIRRVFDERDLQFMLLAHDDGLLVGSSGYFKVSTRASLPDSQLCAANLLIAKSHRSTGIAGMLFEAAIPKLTMSGILTIRADVDPNNTAATVAYERVGFVPINLKPPEQFGRYTLVNYLPGMILQMMALDPDRPWTELFSSAAWRSIPSKAISPEQRREEVLQGLTRYALEGDGASVEILLETATGSFKEAFLDGEQYDISSIVPPPLPPPRLPDLSWQVSDSATARLDQNDGTLYVYAKNHLGPVVVDRFPTDSAAYSWAWRKARIIATDVVQHERGWSTSRTKNGWILSREITFDSEKVRVEVSLHPDPDYVAPRIDPPAAPTVVYSLPMIRMRNTSFSGPIESGTEPEFRNFLVGRNPREAIDFETGSATLAPLRELEGLTSQWRTPFAGVGVTTTYFGYGAPRSEGCSLPGIIGEPTKPFGYEMAINDIGIIQPEINARHSAAPPKSTDSETEWTAVRAARMPAARANTSEHRVDVVDDLGIVKWESEGSPVLLSPFPKRRAWVCAQNWRSGAWWTLQSPRDYLAQGIEWGDQEIASNFEAPGISATDPDREVDLTWTMSLGTRYAEFAGVSSVLDEERELTFVMTPRVARKGQILLGTDRGAPLELPRKTYPWQGSVNRIGVGLQDGRWFVMQPVWANDPEIFIRSTHEAIRLNAMSRVAANSSGEARWAVQIAQDIEEASRLLTI